MAAVSSEVHSVANELIGVKRASEAICARWTVSGATASCPVVCASAGRCLE